MHDALMLHPVNTQVFRPERGEDDHFLSSAGDGDIQSALPSIPIECSEVAGEAAGLIGPESDGEEDHIAFVSLNIFQIFDDGGSGAGIVEEPFQFGLETAGAIEEVFDQFLLRLIKGDDSQRRPLCFRQAEPCLHFLHGFRDECLSFNPIGATASAVKDTGADVSEPDGMILCDG